MTTTYFGILADGNTIEKHTLSEVNDVSEVEYRLKCVKSDAWANPPTFTIIDVKGSYLRFRIGNFEVVNIEEESPGSLGGSKNVLIKELNTGKTHSTQLETRGIEFFNRELLPLLHKLNEIGSWTMYEKLEELDRANKEIVRLKKALADCQSK
ncbi:hypothetical protein [Mucilaginibacter sp. L3T2-6]|uniref:hypothetical protein n=1 Tax=Mucilaginibacter sp. L3T2-6 TaxID=3062491 RepID=UPI002674EAF3|nr:hypothetical protein [Mucilaginibacter sp. L3T2-6]MDO3643851.1 hypothetical protein [Mucilaginibacter sp. L3T2-6]MDV6216426.1 hypothetical protein [Mucilaginibacter sp. L3T2-6]